MEVKGQSVQHKNQVNKASSHIPQQKTTNNRLVELVQVMSSVNTESEEAELNVTSMPDNRGGRVIYTLTEDMVKDLLKNYKKKAIEP